MTGRKERVNVSLDPDVVREARARPEFNLSGFVNRTLRSYLLGNGETPEDAVRRERRRVLEERLAHYTEAREDVQAELDHMDQVDARREAAKTDLEEQWDQARTALINPASNRDRLEIGNPAVENWANKLGITQTELLRELDIEVPDASPPDQAVTDGGEVPSDPD